MMKSKDILDDKLVSYSDIHEDLELVKELDSLYTLAYELSPKTDKTKRLYRWRMQELKHLEECITKDIFRSVGHKNKKISVFEVRRDKLKEMIKEYRDAFCECEARLQ
jgi:hypothetical protein